MKRFKIVVLFPVLWLMACQPNTSSIRPESSGNQHLKLDKKAASVNVQLGSSYLQRGDYASALEKLEKALRQDPNSSSAHNIIAILYVRLGQTEKAEYHYQRAVDISPQYSDAQNNYGVFLYEQGEYEQAIARFKRALENPLYRTPDQAYENAGLSAKKIPDVERAENYLRTALQINPRLSKSLLAMAEITYQRRNFLKSMEYIERYRKAAPWTPQALLQAIKTSQQLGDEDGVASYIVLLRGQFPDSDQARQISGGY